ncbi:MAG: PASTA domain-containing protein [Mycobacterium sp.]
MRKLIVAGVGAASVVMALVGHGVAGADAMSDVTGKYYGQAKEVLSSAGLTPIVATRVGDQVGDDDCVIDRIQRADVARSAGASASSTVYVHLNCYANVASSQQAGYSRQSQLGRAAYEAQQQAAAQAQAEAEAQQQAESEENVTAENQR